MAVVSKMTLQHVKEMLTDSVVYGKDKFSVVYPSSAAVGGSFRLRWLSVRYFGNARGTCIYSRLLELNVPFLDDQFVVVDVVC